MPGTGKSVVGPLVAERLGLSFVDLDRLIEDRTGMAPPAHFERGGEAAFREAEAAALAALEGTTDSVVATGGWTVGDPANRRRMAAMGPTVCLTASPEVLAQRLTATDAAARPLLARGADLTATLRELTRLRSAVYDAIPWHVDTNDRVPAEVAERVVGLLALAASHDAVALPVGTPTGSYSVLIGVGLLDSAGSVVEARGLCGRAAVVSDSHVGPLYGRRLERSLDAAGLTCARVTIAAGESSKTLRTVAEIYAALQVADLDRHSTVMALGGGVVGDTAGFAAATYLRGVRLVQVPTSLLAMVDASIGGKTGVNLDVGKNLVGAFHQPSVVLIDPGLLATLPAEEIANGMAEVVKAALVGDAELLGDLERVGAPDAGDTTAWADLIARSGAVKVAIVAEDPFEEGRRAALNLGHTFAHAIETATGHAVQHGRAVAVGLVAAARLAAAMGVCDGDLPPRIENIVQSLGLPIRLGAEAESVIGAMATDKKRAGGRLRFVLPVAAGRVEVFRDVPQALVRATLDGMAAEPS
jgi:3-dehydroquinate synthase